VAEERNPMNPQGPGGAADPAVPGSDSENPAEIRAEIERTRADMGHTIDEIKERLDPERLKEQAKQSVRDATVGRARAAIDSAQDTLGRAAGRAQDTFEQVAGQAQETAGTVADRMREQRVPAALVGAGVALLLMRRAGRRRRTMYGAGPAGLRGRKPSRGGFEYGGAEARGAGDRAAGRSRLPEHSVATYRLGADRSVTGLLREHPLAASLVAAAGVGYLVMNRAARRPYEPEPAWPDARARTIVADDRGRVGRLVGDARETLRGAALKARDTAGDLAGQAGESLRRAGRQVRATATDLTGNVQEGWHTARARTTNGLDRQIDAHPLALAAAAFAAGAVIGLAAPRTAVEDEYLGEACDSLVDTASDAAHQAGARVREAAQHMTDRQEHGGGVRAGGPTPSTPGSLGSR
jgi:hypothetical protein